MTPNLPCSRLAVASGVLVARTVLRAVHSKERKYTNPMPEYISAEFLHWMVVLADEQSFSAAAQKLHIAPSVLRARTHELSIRVGCQIFLEKENLVKLTEGGRALINVSRDYLAWLEKQKQ